jgi:hypothetical protein
MKLSIGVCAAFLVTAVVMSAPSARAQYNASRPAGDQSESQTRPHPRLEACSSQSVGSTCSFFRDGHKLAGSCQPIAEGQLACIDAIGRPGLLQHPPDAGMSAGDLPNR